MDKSPMSVRGQIAYLLETRLRQYVYTHLHVDIALVGDFWKLAEQREPEV